MPLFSGEVLSQYEGPYWLMTQSSLRFEVPYTRQLVEVGPIGSFLLTWGMSVAFVIFVFVIAPLIKPSDPKVQKSIAFWHYVGLCIFSFVTSAATAYLIISRGEHNDLDAYFCNVVPDWYRALSIAFTISKVWEWMDTAIMVWNGYSLQKIGFLHFYHHLTTFFLFSFTQNFPGTEKVGLLLNGFVHTLMYYHYAFRLPRFMRPVITIAQIIQLFLGTISHHINITTCKAYAGYLDEYPFSAIIPYLFVPVYLLFFIRFFFQTYVFSAPTPAPTGDKKAPVDTKTVKKD